MLYRSYYYDETALAIRNKCKEIFEWIIDNKCTLSEASKELGYSKSDIYRTIHSYIKCYYNDEYYQIKRILEYNRKYRFKPKKYWERRRDF